MRHIILPQVTKIVLPSVFNEIMSLVKDTSLVYALGISDLIFGKSDSSQSRCQPCAYVFSWGDLFDHDWSCNHCSEKSLRRSTAITDRRLCWNPFKQILTTSLSIPEKANPCNRRSIRGGKDNPAHVCYWVGNHRFKFNITANR